MKKLIGFISLIAVSAAVYAGGNPAYVKFPDGYKNNFTKYDTRNRSNDKQVADLYANDVAINSVKSGELAAGSVIVMEVHKPVLDESGNKVTGTDGIYEKAGLAAVAVMERRDDWSAEFPSSQRTGGWGYAIYNPDGSPKENDLDCVSCHAPLAGQEYLFTHDALTGH